MQFVTSGNRIAVENFTVGYLYTITFTGGEYIHCACTGIGMDFVMFSRTAPEYTFALTMETAEDVSSIDLYSEGGGTTNYNELTNKPQINSIEIVGNKSLNDLGIQPVITNDNKLSYTLVSGLGTAATTSSSDYATAAEGALAATAVQPADLNAYQTKIDAEHMLSADLVDDTSTTKKFATAAELLQIQTNKTNILSSLGANGAVNLLIPNLVDKSTYGVYTISTHTFSEEIGHLDTTRNTLQFQCYIGDGNSLSTVTTSSLVINRQITSPQTNAWSFLKSSSYDKIWFGHGAASGGVSTTFMFDISNLENNKTYWIIVTFDNVVHADSNPQPYAWKNVMLVEDSMFNLVYNNIDYQPYAMSNAEITAWILAHS